MDAAWGRPAEMPPGLREAEGKSSTAPLKRSLDVFTRGTRGLCASNSARASRLAAVRRRDDAAAALPVAMRRLTESGDGLSRRVSSSLSASKATAAAPAAQRPEASWSANSVERRPRRRCSSVAWCRIRSTSARFFTKMSVSRLRTR